MDHTVTTSEKILASARELIIAGGYNGFSYADIARVVGIRKASIHHHFPTKADLVRNLVIAYREEAEAGLAMTEQQAPDALSALRGYVGYWQHCITQTSRPFCICALLATEMPVLPAEVAAEVQRFFSYLSRWTHRQME
ncbi:TetR/AcrR family transcriptional regulator, partial [Thioclava sp. BHET1]